MTYPLYTINDFKVGDVVIMHDDHNGAAYRVININENKIEMPLFQSYGDIHLNNIIYDNSDFDAMHGYLFKLDGQTFIYKNDSNKITYTVFSIENNNEELIAYWYDDAMCGFIKYKNFLKDLVDGICICQPSEICNDTFPKNNDNRTICFDPTCKGNIKQVQGFSNTYGVCEKCGR